MSFREEKTILCIDDDQVALSGWCLYLQTKGYKVVGASSPEDGLQIFGTQPVDAVILDYTMPELNGRAVSGLMKQIKPEVPIVLFTGSDGVPTAIYNNVDEYVLKGGEPTELLAKIDNILNVSV